MHLCTIIHNCHVLAQSQNLFEMNQSSMNLNTAPSLKTIGLGGFSDHTLCMNTQADSELVGDGDEHYYCNRLCTNNSRRWHSRSYLQMSCSSTLEIKTRTFKETYYFNAKTNLVSNVIMLILAENRFWKQFYTIMFNTSICILVCYNVYTSIETQIKSYHVKTSSLQVSIFQASIWHLGVLVLCFTHSSTVSVRSPWLVHWSQAGHIHVPSVNSKPEIWYAVWRLVCLNYRKSL